VQPTHICAALKLSWVSPTLHDAEKTLAQMHQIGLLLRPANQPRTLQVNAACPAPSDPAAAGDAGQNIGMLQELLELGMQLARAAADRAVQAIKAPLPGPDEPGRAPARGPDPTQVFLRLWASVRQTISLQRRLAKNLVGPAAEASQPQPSMAEAPAKAPEPAKPLPPRMAQVQRDLARRRAAKARAAAMA
jgi:hypothetical protein